MNRFTVAELEKPQYAAAWPLIRMAAPEVPPERWAEHAEELTAAGGGVLGVFSGDSTLHGFADYRPDQALRWGKVLRVDNIVTFELSRHAPARRALCAALEGIARGLGCKAVILATGSRGYADGASPRAKGWAELGHRLDSVLFAKPVPAAAAEQAA